MTRPPDIKPGPDNRIRETHTNRFTILTVCTANICRSPLMELLLRQQLDTSVYEVGSAGIRGIPNSEMEPDAAKQARRFGTDPQYFRSRAVTADMVKVSGLILTATREHRSSVLSVEPMALRRTFTLREFAQLVAEYAGETLSGLVSHASHHRSLAKGELDVGDPYLRGELVHQQVAERIVRGTREVSTVLNELGAHEGLKH